MHGTMNIKLWFKHMKESALLKLWAFGMRLVEECRHFGANNCLHLQGMKPYSYITMITVNVFSSKRSHTCTKRTASDFGKQ